MLKRRFVEILMDNEWQIRTYAAIRKGMVFRLFDDNGKMLETPNGTGKLLALDDVKIENGDYYIEFVYSN